MAIIGRNSSFLKNLYYSSEFHRKVMIEVSNADQLESLCQIAEKIVFREIFITDDQKQQLLVYRGTIALMGRLFLADNTIRTLLLANIGVIPHLIQPVLHLLDEE